MDERKVDDIVRSIAIGTPVDWDSAGSEPADASLSDVLRELRVIEQVADVHAIAERSAVPHDLPAGHTWEGLTLIERIGRGAYASVYRARENRLAREVALKLLPARPDDERAQAIIEEARLLARLTHPNVATVFGAECRDGFVGIWMEFVRGTNLEEFLREQGPLDPASVCDIGAQLCAALAAVHRAGMLHRDIKASNVRRTANGRIVLVDFGSGRDLSDATASEQLVGTPLYLAPELLEGGAATVHSDLYSVGVLLYHLLTNSYPVQGRTIADLRKAHSSAEAASVRRARPDTPRRIAALIDRAIHPSPDVRFIRAAEMESALRSARAFPRRLALVASAVATFTAATALGAWLVATRAGSPPSTRGTAAAWLSAQQLNWSIDWSVLGGPSPNGRLLSYADNTGDLAVLDLRTGEHHKVTSRGPEEYATFSVFSPDSRQIAYAWHQESCECDRVRIIDPNSLAMQTLALDDSLSNVRLFDWSRDGSFLLALIEPKAGRPSLEIVSVLDGRRRPLKTAMIPFAAALSPDDRFIVYDVAARLGQPRDIHILDVATLSDRPLISGPDDEGDPFWINDNVLYTSTRDGKRMLWRVRVASGGSTASPAPFTDLIEPGFWPLGVTTGGSLYYGAREGGSYVFIADATRDDVSIPSRATTATEPEVSPEWSPDGRMLVWVATWGQSGRVGATLRFRDIASGREHDLTPSFAVGQNPRWSPDGKTILIRGADDRGAALRLIDLANGKLLASYLQGRTFGDVEWLPDGRGAVYIEFQTRLIGHLDIPSGRDSVIYRLPPDQTLGRGLALSPDGRSIAASVFERGGSAIHIIPVTGGAARPLIRLKAPDSLLLQEWTRDGRAVMFVRSREIPGAIAAQEWHLWSIDAAGGEARYLNLSMPDLGTVRPSPDGRRLAFTSRNSRNRIRVLDNVLTALRESR